MRIISFALAALLGCGSSTPSPAPPGNAGQQGACEKSGCSGTVCTTPGNAVVTTCEYKPEYACYETASCARQPDGKCGWTASPELAACLSNPPAK